MTTLNLQVSANGDDGWDSASFGFRPNDSDQLVGNLGGNSLNIWDRFTGVSGLSGATINSADYQVYGVFNQGGTATTNIYAEDAAAPAAPTGSSDYNGKTTTTAFVAWDAAITDNTFNSAPDISSVIQELADSYDPSVIQILHKNDGSSVSNWQRHQQHDTNNSQAAKLDIDYTAGGGGGSSVRKLVNGGLVNAGLVNCGLVG